MPKILKDRLRLFNMIQDKIKKKAKIYLDETNAIIICDYADLLLKQNNIKQDNFKKNDEQILVNFEKEIKESLQILQNLKDLKLHSSKQ
jgi:ATP-dependent protease HslVU (ClpYQ) ATPase subunit